MEWVAMSTFSKYKNGAKKYPSGATCGYKKCGNFFRVYVTVLLFGMAIPWSAYRYMFYRPYFDSADCQPQNIFSHVTEFIVLPCTRYYETSHLSEFIEVLSPPSANLRRAASENL